jgi:tetratricopeptide (TPR) repeat protein
MNHPHLTELFKIYQAESQPFRKVHRMIDLFESIIKSHTVVIIAEYVKHNKLSEAAKGMLAQGLRTPSLGTWQLFSRILSEELNADGYAWTFTGFPEDFAALDKALNAAKTNVISFRNGYAHGATPTDDQCESDIRQFEPFLIQLLGSHWLSNTTLENRDNKVWIVSDAGELCLHPILLSKDEGGSSPYAFFNDLKNDKVGLLNYPLSKHYREKQFYQEFHQYLPLNEWKKSGNNEFYQRIEELTETFKGRTIEREKLLNFVVEKNKGYLSIQGNPGIGKSALIAQFFKDLKPKKEIQRLQIVEYFIRRGTAQAQVEYLFNYLIRKTDELFSAGKEIRAEGKAVWDLQQQLFSKWRLWGEQNNGSKLLFLIDGLDEGVENNVVSYLPRENFEGILIIYGSRPGGHKSIDELWAQLPIEHHTKLELSGLSKEDIRALIYDVTNKYEIERDSIWIDAVQERSQGNPLYLKLLCDALEFGSIQPNDTNALPEKIDEYYKAILLRYANDPDGDALLYGLFTFAAAKDYLTINHLGLVNKLGDATALRIGSTLKEVLYENPLTDEVLDYQLFHESFREYLVKEKGSKMIEAAERIIDFCSGWKGLEGSWEQRYALEHYAVHLKESKKELRAEILFQLIYDNSYTSAQKKVLKGFDASNELYRIALKKSCELKRGDDMLEAALCLVDLKYEEANDAPQIVAMVANGDINLALKRIESFGGVDAEGMKRKFILYMICLMELTLLESKNKPFRKVAIEKFLNHLDENIPVDHSLLNWNDFFPSNLMFLMARDWADMGLDYIRVYRRTDGWEADWISEIGHYSYFSIEVLIECARNINHDRSKSPALRAISTELAKQGKLDEALQCARSIGDDRQRSDALADISIVLAKQGKLEEALAFTRDIIKGYEKIYILITISSELVKKGKLEEGELLIQDSLTWARGIIDDWQKSYALITISSELVKQGKLEEGELLLHDSLACARGIIDDWQKSDALRAISSELVKQGKLEDGELVIQESLSCVQGISNEFEKYLGLTFISAELAKQGKLNEALQCALSIGDDKNKSDALADISIVLATKGKLKESLEYTRSISDDWKKSNALIVISKEFTKRNKLENSLECARGISIGSKKSEALREISSELTKLGKLEEAISVMQQLLECSQGVSGDWQKSDALRAISSELIKQDKLEKGTSVLQESLVLAHFISNEKQKNDALIEISKELVKQGKLEEALACSQSIISDRQKNYALADISIVLAKQGKLEEAVAFTRDIVKGSEKIFNLITISSELVKQGKLEEGTLLIHELLVDTQSIIADWEKGSALADISRILVKQGKIVESLECARGISHEESKSLALGSISTELAKLRKFVESSSIMQESLQCALGISDNWQKSIALGAISAELAKQGKMQESLECARGIRNDRQKSIALGAISMELAKQGEWQLAEKVGLEITQIAERYDCWKSIAKSIKAKDGWKFALNKHIDLQNDESRLFYLKGWVESIEVNDVNFFCLKDALPFIIRDSDSIEKLLQAYSQHVLFFNNPSIEDINRLNKTLNIQWILDIVAKFPKVESMIRSSSNLSEWIDQIQDEDDREEIELLARKVAKGKMTEQEFGERLKDF